MTGARARLRGSRVWLSALVLALALAWGEVRIADADGASLTVGPTVGACTDTISVHAEGVQPGLEILLLASAPSAPPEVITYDRPNTSAWDFTVPPGVRYLCDDIAAPIMQLSLWADTTDTLKPTVLLASATFTRTQADAVAPGPTLRVIPDHGTCDTPMLLVGSGFPPNEPVDVALGPIYSLPGSGGAWIGLGGGTTAPDGSYRSEILSTQKLDGSPAGSVTDSIGSRRCGNFGRLLIRVDSAKNGGAEAFPPAAAVFRRADIAAPAAGSGAAPADSTRDVETLGWPLIAGGAILAGWWSLGRRGRA